MLYVLASAVVTFSVTLYRNNDLVIWGLYRLLDTTIKQLLPIRCILYKNFIRGTTKEDRDKLQPARDWWSRWVGRGKLFSFERLAKSTMHAYLAQPWTLISCELLIDTGTAAARSPNRLRQPARAQCTVPTSTPEHHHTRPQWGREQLLLKGSSHTHCSH